MSDGVEEDEDAPRAQGGAAFRQFMQALGRFEKRIAKLEEAIDANNELLAKVFELVPDLVSRFGPLADAAAGAAGSGGGGEEGVEGTDWASLISKGMDLFGDVKKKRRSR